MGFLVVVVVVVVVVVEVVVVSTSKVLLKLKRFAASFTSSTCTYVVISSSPLGETRGWSLLLLLSMSLFFKKRNLIYCNNLLFGNIIQLYMWKYIIQLDMSTFSYIYIYP